MAGMAATLQVLVQVKGIQQASKDLRGVEGNLGDAERAAIKATSQLQKFGSTRAVAKARVDVDDKDLQRTNDTMKITIERSNLLGRTMALVKPAGMIAAVGVAAQALAAFSAGAIAAVSALGPLAGGLAAYPALFVAFKQGALVAKFALSGVSSAMEAFSKALEKPTPAMKAFKDQISGFVPDIVRLRDLAQGPILRGLSDGVQAASANLGRLGPIVSATATVIGRLAKEAGTLVGSSGFGRDMATIGARNAKIIDDLGHAALSVADAMRHVLVAAGPLVSWLAKLAAGWAAGLRDTAAMGRETGRLGDFFDKTRVAMTHVFSIAGSLGTAFMNIAKAAYPLGESILAALDKAAQGLASWTGSVQGQNQLAAYFERAKPAIFEVGRLIADVTKGFFSLSSQPGLAKIIAQLRTELLPILLRVVNSTTAAFGPAFVDMIVSVAKAFEPLAGSSGPLVFYVKVLTDLANVATWITTNVPGAAQAITFLLGAMAVSKAVGFAGALTGVTSALTALRAGTITSTAIMVTHRIAMIATTVATTAAAIATGGFTTVFWALNAALVAHPIGVVVVALVALGAGLVLAYKHSETFRNIVDAVFKWLKTAASNVFGFLGTFIPATWGVISSVTSTVWGAIKGFLTTTFTVIKAIVTAVFPAIQAIITTVWNVVSTVTGTVWNAIKTVLTTVWNLIKLGATTYFEAIKLVITTIWTAISTVTSTIWNAMKTALIAIWNALKVAAGLAWEAIRTVIVNPILAVVAFGKTQFENFKVGLGVIWNAIKSAASVAWAAIKTAIIDPIRSAAEWVLDKISWLADRVSVGWARITKGAVDFANDLKDKISDAFKGAANLAIGFINAIIGAINAIPGVPNIGKIAKLAEGGVHGGGPNGNGTLGLARGGAFARTGGIVNSPITLMGEEAPCIARGTLIETSMGKRPIERVKVGERVLTRSGYRQVVWSGITRRDAEVLRVTSVDGDNVLCTPDHRIWTMDGGRDGDGSGDCLGSGALRGRRVLSDHEGEGQESVRDVGFRNDGPRYGREVPEHRRLREHPTSASAGWTQDDVLHGHREAGGCGTDHPSVSSVAGCAPEGQGARAAGAHRSAQRASSVLRERPAPVDPREHLHEPEGDSRLQALQGCSQRRMGAQEVCDRRGVSAEGSGCSQGVRSSQARDPRRTRAAECGQARLMAPDACWREARDIAAGDWVWALRADGELHASRVATVERTAERIDTYDLCVEVDHEFVAGGILVHNSHPEFVIPSNPAYRSRAQALLTQAAGAIGMAGGGVWGAVKGAVGGAAGAVGSVLSGGADAILGMLPGVGDLPDWLKGSGKWVLDKVTGWIKDKIGSLFGAGGGGGASSGAPSGPAPSGSLNDWLSTALRATGQYSAANLAALYRRAMQESGGDPKAINLWDSNAKAGIPSKGLLQTIDPTFNSYKMAGHGNIWDPVDNSIAAIRYMIARYGRIVDANGQGYAMGGKYGGLLGSYANGTNYVPQTGPYMLHRGESVTPAGASPDAIVAAIRDANFTIMIGGQVIDERVEVIVDRRDRGTQGTWSAGVSR